MIQKSRGEFTLRYDPLADTADLFFHGDSLVARSPRPNCWAVIDGRGWFEFDYSTKRRRHHFGEDLRGQLNHIRALSGKADDVISHVHRLAEMKDLRGWDRWWKSTDKRK